MNAANGWRERRAHRGHKRGAGSDEQEHLSGQRPDRAGISTCRGKGGLLAGAQSLTNKQELALQRLHSGYLLEVPVKVRGSALKSTLSRLHAQRHFEHG
jgi:hypothetical protein